MSSRHHQDGHATFIHDPESALAEKQEDSDFEHQPPGQTANISEEQRASDRVVDKDESRTLPVSSLDWNGPDDPDNPHNWSIWKAAYHTTIPAVFGFAVPVVGGFVAQYKTWKWTQWCILFLALFVYIIALPMSETYKPIILKKRAKKQGIVTKQETADLTSEIVMRFIRPLHLISTEPVVFFFSLYTGFAFAVLFLFFAAFPYVFTRPPYSFTPSQSGLVFIPILIGVILGGITTIIVDRTLYQKKYRETVSNGKSHVDPEHRLYSAMGGAWGMVIGLFWFGWCADQGVHWAPTIIGVIPFAWGNLCVFTSSALYLSDVYGAMNGASAIAANGIVRYILGAVFPLFTVQMYDALGIGWATSLLGFLSLGMVPIPFLFFKYGPAIRAKSRYPVAI
ncbi:unnamed protein product [Alternaria alternata]